MPTPITASTLSALVSAALAQKPTRPLVLALDGRCGSGKTTLANGLAAQFPGCTLLRTDDFYLPPARRSPDWAHTPCANMDLTRLRDEALRPAYAGQPVAYRAYSCREGAYLPPAQLPATPFVAICAVPNMATMLVTSTRPSAKRPFSIAFGIAIFKMRRSISKLRQKTFFALR